MECGLTGIVCGFTWFYKQSEINCQEPVGNDFWQMAEKWHLKKWVFKSQKQLNN